MIRRTGWSLAVALILLVAAGCGGDEAAGGDGELTVYAASSLTDVLPAIDPGPRYSFAGSDELATQIRADIDRARRLLDAG